jgi:molecular chaperone GrpE
MAEAKRKDKEKKKVKIETPDESALEEAESVEMPAAEDASVQAKAAERDEFLDLLQRTRAEFSNYRKRIERDRETWGPRAVGDFVLKLLPVLDDFDRALAHAEESTDFESFVKGIRLIESKIYDVLKSSGIEPFVPAGEPFDPAEHDAMIMEARDDVPENHVSEVLLKGYRQGDRVLRHAQVKVAKSAPAEAPETDADDDKPSGEEEEESDADV